MEMLSQVWNQIQHSLFPHLEEVLDPLTEKQRKLVAILELVRIEEFVQHGWWRGRPRKNRGAIARALVAKMVYNLPSTVALIDLLRSSLNLRRLCGFERLSDIPSGPTFSRAFLEFAKSELPQRVHRALLEKYESKRLVGHISRDSTAIVGREKAVAKAKQQSKKAQPKRKRGRPRKGEARAPQELTRLQRQRKMSLPEMLAELPKHCDWGYQKKNGKPHYWQGFKCHVDWADGEIPITCILTSASLHDSQAAVPLTTCSSERVDYCYELMDAAYDAQEIREYSRALGHVPIIEANPRGGPKKPMDPATWRRYQERSTAERGFSMLKESFGASMVRVRGYLKVMTHLMFGILALTAQQLLKLVI